MKNYLVTWKVEHEYIMAIKANDITEATSIIEEGRYLEKDASEIDCRNFEVTSILCEEEGSSHDKI